MPSWIMSAGEAEATGSQVPDQCERLPQQRNKDKAKKEGRKHLPSGVASQG